MANPYLNNLAELRLIEARLDQRIDLLTKAEANLKGLFEALRQQVSTAYPVLNQLKEAIPAARERIDESALNERADKIADAMTEKLYQSIEQAKEELGNLAGPIRQQMIDDLRAVVMAGKASLEAVEPPRPDPAAQQDALRELAEEFRIEARGIIESVRESLIDQVNLLRADADLRVEPILDQITQTRSEAESRLEAIVQAQQEAMTRRVEQLSAGIDEIATHLEERLTQRVQGMQRRAGDAVNAIEATMRSRLDRAMDELSRSVDAGEQRLLARVESIRPRLDAELRGIDSQLTDRLQRMEKHASAMGDYLEQKLTSHVDELIQRLRLRLQDEISTVSGGKPPVSRLRDATESPERPSLEVELFVNRQQKPAAA